MSRGLRILLGAVAACAAWSVPARAQCTVSGLTGATCVQTRTITATVGRTVRVTVTPSVTTLVAPADADFANGFTVSAGPTVQVRSNVPWQVTIGSASPTWTGTLGARSDKPRAELLWGTTSAGPWTPMAGTAAVFATGAATNATVAPLFYRVDWSFALDAPGSYAIALQYTISST